eukprot:gene13796-29329_t
MKTINNQTLLVIAASAVVIPIAATVFYMVFSKTETKPARKANGKKKKSFYAVVEDKESRVSLDTAAFNTPTSWTALGLDQPMVIAMVGLPARGKSYIVKMIIRYLNWSTYEAQVFNVGSYRRKIGLAGADSSFFDMSNKDNQKVRENMAMAVQEDMYNWLHSGNNQKSRVAIFDATNTTRDRRQALAHRARQENVSLLFVESICNDQ